MVRRGLGRFGIEHDAVEGHAARLHLIDAAATAENGRNNFASLAEAAFKHRLVDEAARDTLGGGAGRINVVAGQKARLVDPFFAACGLRDLGQDCGHWDLKFCRVFFEASNEARR